MGVGSWKNRLGKGRYIKRFAAVIAALLATIFISLVIVATIGAVQLNDTPAIVDVSTQSPSQEIADSSQGSADQVVSKDEPAPAVPLFQHDSGADVSTSETLADGQKVSIRWDEESGTPAFITGPVSTPQAASVPESAIAFLSSNKDLYRMTDPAAELEPNRVVTDDLGITHVHLKQSYKGVPVFGALLAVHMNAEGQITAINGDYVPGIDLSIEPDIGEDEAVAAAQTDLNSSAGASDHEPVELIVLAPEGQDAALTWKVTLAADDPPLRMVYFIDAHTGKVVTKYNALEDAKNRMTYTANNGTSLPGTLVITESGGSGDSVTNIAHYNAGVTYDYYYNTFGRDSINNSGLTITSTVHYSSNYNNAFWNGYQMVYGDGDGSVFSPLCNGLDVVAHELTHGVTQYTAGLIYSYQSGALNESYSDVFGAMVDRDDWLMGEDVYTPSIPGDALRSLSNPPLYGQPGHMNDYVNTSSDNGGVHTNSGIPNKASYNVAAVIGKDKMEQIWYRTLTYYLTPSTQFDDARDASVQAAADLYGSTSAEVAAVDSGFSAVGINGSGPPSETTARIEIDHSYRGDLVVTLGVGDPASPEWSTVVSNREGGSADNIYLTVDIDGGADHLPPSWQNRWFLKVYDAAGYDTGQIKTFTVTDHETTYAATDVPVQINDYQTSYSYIPTDDDVPPTIISTTPTNGTIGVYSSSSISATFSEDIATSTLTGSSFSMKENATQTPVEGEITYDAGSKTAVLNPSSELEYSTDYDVTLTTDITDMAGNNLEQGQQLSFTTAPPPKNYYFTWYDMQGSNVNDWLVMGNPATETTEAGFDIFIENTKQNSSPLMVPTGSTLPQTFNGKIGGPVQIASLNGDSRIVSKRTLFGDSFEEVVGIEESRLDSHYYYTWYDYQSPGARDWVLMANPGTTPVEADVYIAGEKMNDTPYEIGSGETKTPEFEGVMGGPVEVIAYEPGNESVPRDIISSQRVLWHGDFNEMPGIPASELKTEYMSSWYDQQNAGLQSWVLVANPHDDKELAAEIWIGGEKMTDSASGNQYFTVEPGSNIVESFPGVVGGPLVVKGYDAALYDPVNPGEPDTTFYTTQRSLYWNSFEEIVGYGADQLSPIYHYTFYDQASSGAMNWLLISNPGASEIKAEVWIAGVKQQVVTVPAEQAETPLFPGLIGGPVEVRGYDSATYDPGNPGTPNAELFTSQRVVWKGHFNEVGGTVVE